MVEENEALSKEIENEHAKFNQLEYYLCSFCELELPVFVLSCGHMVCEVCSNQYTCKICKKNPKSRTEIKNAN